LLMTTSEPVCSTSMPARSNEVLALRVESCSPGLLRLARHSASGDCGPLAGVLAAEPVHPSYSS
jgi:hypothetical protein